MRNSRRRYKLTIVLCVCLIVTVLRPPPLSRGRTEGFNLEQTPTLTPHEQQTREAIRRAVANAQLELYPGYFLDVETVTLDHEFAVVEVLAKYRNTGERVATEGTIILARRVDETWQVALPGTEPFSAWLPLIPESFLPESVRVALLSHVPSETPAPGSLNGDYKLPYPADVGCFVTQGNHQGPSHYLNPYAFDFAMPEGSTVVAARPGTAIMMKEDSSEGGCSSSGIDKGNYVVIDHGDGTSGLYLHLKHEGVSVTVGEQVAQGQEIARSGQTGYACGAHLHFVVQRTPTGPSPFSESLPISFSDADVLRQNADGVPTTGNHYVSSNHSPSTSPPVTVTPARREPVAARPVTEERGPAFYPPDVVQAQYGVPLSTKRVPSRKCYLPQVISRWDSTHTDRSTPTPEVPREAEHTSVPVDQSDQVDREPPDSRAVLGGSTGDDAWYVSPAQVSLFAQDGSAGPPSATPGITESVASGVREITYRVDEGPWQTYGGPFSVDNDGIHTMEYYATDNAGNTESAHTVSLRIDALPPSVPSAAHEVHGVMSGQWQKSTDEPSFTWPTSTDVTSGVWGYEVYFGHDRHAVGHTWREAESYHADRVGTGTYYLRARCTDKAGNWSAWTTIFTFMYDCTPPDNPTVTHKAGITSDSGQRDTRTADFIWDEPYDEGAGIQGYYLYWGPDENGVADGQFTARHYISEAPICAEDEAATWYLRLRSVDKAGNQASEWATAFVLRHDAASATGTFIASGYGHEVGYLPGVTARSVASGPAAAPTPARTLEAANTPTASPEPTSTPTDMPQPSATSLDTPQPSATATDTPQLTSTPTDTPGPTSEPTATARPTSAPTDTPWLSTMATETPQLTNTPTDTPRPASSPTSTPRATGTPTHTPRPSSAPTPIPWMKAHVRSLEGMPVIARLCPARFNEPEDGSGSVGDCSDTADYAAPRPDYSAEWNRYGFRFSPSEGDVCIGATGNPTGYEYQGWLGHAYGWSYWDSGLREVTFYVAAPTSTHTGVPTIATPFAPTRAAISGPTPTVTGAPTPIHTGIRLGTATPFSARLSLNSQPCVVLCGPRLGRGFHAQALQGQYSGPPPVQRDVSLVVTDAGEGTHYYSTPLITTAETITKVEGYFSLGSSETGDPYFGTGLNCDIGCEGGDASCGAGRWRAQARFEGATASTSWYVFWFPVRLIQ